MNHRQPPTQHNDRRKIPLKTARDTTPIWSTLEWMVCCLVILNFPFHFHREMKHTKSTLNFKKKRVILLATCSRAHQFSPFATNFEWCYSCFTYIHFPGFLFLFLYVSRMVVGWVKAKFIVLMCRAFLSAPNIGMHPSSRVGFVGRWILQSDRFSLCFRMVSLSLSPSLYDSGNTKGSGKKGSNKDSTTTTTAIDDGLLWGRRMVENGKLSHTYLEIECSV